MALSSEKARRPPRARQEPLPEKCMTQVVKGIRALAARRDRAQREASRAASVPPAPLLSGPIGKRGRARTLNPGPFCLCGETEERIGWVVGRGGKPLAPGQWGAPPGLAAAAVEKGREGSRTLRAPPSLQGPAALKACVAAPRTTSLRGSIGPGFRTQRAARQARETAARKVHRPAEEGALGE